MTAFDAWWTPGPALRGEPGDAGRSGELVLRAPEVDGAAVESLARRLRRGREEALASLDADDVVDRIDAVASRFLRRGDRLREQALELLPLTTGYAPAMAERVLGGMARDWQGDRLRGLLEAEFDDPAVLDAFRPGPRGRRLRALGPELTFHVGAGNVPGVTVTSLVRALLVKSAALVKPGSGDPVLPVLFARGLAGVDPELAEAVAVVYWPGGAGGPEEAALAAADATVAYGGDEAIRALRGRAPDGARIVAYHHRVSFGIVARDALSAERVEETAYRAAEAASIFEQRGCVSPHLFYAERGGDASPELFAERLAGAFRRLEGELPSGRLRPDEASAIHQLRGEAELEAAAGGGRTVYRSDDAAWTVVYDHDPAFEPSCLNRVVRVKPVDEVHDVADRVRRYRRHLQTVGVAGAGGRLAGLAEVLGKAGVTRVAPLASMAWPPPWWHHDGMDPLRPLVRWVDLEG